MIKEGGALMIALEADRLAVATALVKNGYTVWIETVRNGNKAAKVLRYEKGRAEGCGRYM